ncbi:MAG: type VI secretion protein ImpB [Robiginitomaculum sp.]|nr:MAG: type VI secretion protein ImpB [Robiginitomaculum sp.]
MRKPTTIERLYLDFDGFFASVEQQARPALRGKPVGVVPFDGTEHTVVIACSKEAKARGVKNVMKVRDAKRICPDIKLVAQTPDLYRRAHNTLLREIEAVIPIDVIKSIDELSCILDPKDIADPVGLSDLIKKRIHDNVGPYISCSIGFAANRHLAKIACKMDKPNGTTIWFPEIMPLPLLDLPFDDIPGIGSGMERRLHKAGIYGMRALMKTEPKQMRKLWGNVTGERLWYALNGYDVQAQPSKRGMYGHGRVLDPDNRSIIKARETGRYLLIKAARRMRRDGFYANALYLGLAVRIGRKDGRCSEKGSLPCVNDDQAVLAGFEPLWAQICKRLPNYAKVIRVFVTFDKLMPSDARQLDMFVNDDPERVKMETLTSAMDELNKRYGKSLVTLGPYVPPGQNAGNKIAFTRIPAPEDAW